MFIGLFKVIKVVFLFQSFQVFIEAVLLYCTAGAFTLIVLYCRSMFVFPGLPV